MIRAAILAGAVFAACVSACVAVQAQTNAPANPQAPPAPNASAQGEASSPALPNGPAVTAELNGTVDSRKVKAGDKVEARTIEALKNGNDIIIPKGTKLVGHVTEASARAKGDNDSSLAIQFDEAVPKKEQEIPLHLMILAVAAPAQGNLAGDFPSSSSDPLAGTVASTQTSPMGASRPQNPNPVNYPAPGATDSTGATAGSNASGSLPASSRGVYGLKDLKLMVTSSKANTATTVITSTGKDVRLDGGVRLLLVMAAEAPAAPAQ